MSSPNQIQFKQIEPRLLGPMSLLVQSNEDGTSAKGIDLILPAFTWALELRLYLPMPEALLKAKATEGYIRIDQDVELSICSPPAMTLSVRFPENFYEKYSEYIENRGSFKIMAYVLGYLERPGNMPTEAQQEGSIEAGQEQLQLAEANI